MEGERLVGVAKEIKFSIDKLWFNFILHSSFIFLSSKLIIIQFQTQKQRIIEWILACKYILLSLLLANRTVWTKEKIEPAGPSDQCITLAIWHSWVRVLLWLLTGFVLGCPKFKSLAMLVNSQLFTSCQGRGGGFNPVMLYLDYLCLIIWVT